MLVIVGTHVSVTIETQGDAVVKAIVTPFGPLRDMVKLDLQSAETVAEAAVPSARDKDFLPNGI
jgi:hypothetical protein